jgi:genome maintenance exonuclease 1
MPTQPYMVGGRRVPSVTTVLGRFKSPDALVHWAWKLGLEGKDYRTVRDDAADAGTLTHALIEADIRGAAAPSLAAYPDDVVGGAVQAFEAYRAWRASTGAIPARTEVSLVSERHRFGGTYDALLLGEERVIADWKTSKRIYPEHVIQLGGYALLHDEHFPGEPLAGGLVLRFARDGSGFETHRVTKGELFIARGAFLELLAAYKSVAFLERSLRRDARHAPEPTP